MSRIHESITDTIGGTPLVSLDRVASAHGAKARVLGKIESFNPAGSVKDRLALAIVETAEASGELPPGGTVVEGTSGNTGIGLAAVGAARGYRVVLTMPDTMSSERRAILRALGAELVLTPGADGMRGAVERAREIVAETPGAVLARQFENEAGPRVHFETTGQEILRDTDGEVDILVSGIGTGGTITGAGRALREARPGVQIIAVEPKDSPILTGGKPGPHKIQGLGANFVPDVLDREVYDEVVDVTIEESIELARELATRQGILAGISSGAALAAALRVAVRDENADKTLVVILPDTGERYVSTLLFEGLRD